MIIKSIGKNTFLNISGQVVPLFIAFLTIPITMKHFGNDRFGILTISWLFLGYSVLFDLGMGRAVVKFSSLALKENKLNQIPGILRTAVQVQLIIGFFITTVFFLFSDILINNLLTIPSHLLFEAKKTFIVASSSVPIILVCGSYRGLLESIGRFDIVNFIKVIFSSITYAIPLLGYYFNFSLISITQILIIFYLLQLLTIHFIVKLYIKGISILSLFIFDFNIVKKIFAFSGWVSLSNIISLVQENIERLLIAGLMPISMVPYYSIPKDMLDRIYVLPSSLCKTLFPIVSRTENPSKLIIIDLFLNSFKFIIFITSIVLLVIVIFSDLILKAWINTNFSELATPVILCLSLGVLFSSLNMIFLTFFQGLGMPDITAKLQTIRFPIIIIVSYFSIKYLGLSGAAFSWTFGRALAFFMNLLFFNKKIDMGSKKILDFKMFILVSVFPFFLLIYYIFIYNKNFDFLYLLIFLIVSIIIYLLFFWLFILSNNNKNTLIDIFYRWKSIIKK